jgi:ubiquinone/menaquinone biosynthesis C-methylase UbiE
MTIIKAKDFIDVYRQKAAASDLNELSGRTGRPDVTAFIASKIIADIDLKNGMVLVDIGCGDASLLKAAAAQFEDRLDLIGIVPTQEEADRLSAHLLSLGKPFDKIQILKGDHEHIPLSDGVAQRVVANGTLILIPERERIQKALSEMARIADENALVYVGEIPMTDELAERNYGDSIHKWLFWTLKNQGLKAFWRRIKQTVKAVISHEPFVIAPKQTFYCSDTDFIELLTQNNLITQEAKPHTQPGIDGHMEACRSRMNYWTLKSGQAN